MFYYFSYCCSIIFQDICKIKHFTSYEIFYLYFFVRISRFYLHLILNTASPCYTKYRASFFEISRIYFEKQGRFFAAPPPPLLPFTHACHGSGGFLEPSSSVRRLPTGPIVSEYPFISPRKRKNESSVCFYSGYFTYLCSNSI